MPAPKSLAAEEREGLHREATPGKGRSAGFLCWLRSRPGKLIALITAVIVAGAIVLIALLPDNGSSPTPVPYQLKTAARALEQPAGQPVLWLQTSATPSQAEIQKAAASARVVVLNAWELGALKELKRLNPKITVLVYKDLSSTRSYEGAVVDGKDAALLPTGVGYVNANTNHSDWFAVDSGGQRIQWNGYAGHWQMAVWNASYQAAWVSSVVSEVQKNGWDGILADNALDSLRYYSTATLGGGGSEDLLASGVEQLVKTVGTELNKSGKVVIPNIPDGRANLARFEELSAFGGAFEEQYAHFGTDPSAGFLGDPESSEGISGQPDSTSEWDRQAIEVASAGTILVHTQAPLTDRRSFLYGYGSFLAAGGGFGAFSATVPDGYSGYTLQPEQTWAVPVTSAPLRKLGSLRYRWFSTLFAAVNPSQSVTLVVKLPQAMTNGSGQTVTSVTLAPHTGVVLKRPTSTLNPTLEMPISLQ